VGCFEAGGMAIFSLRALVVLVPHLVCVSSVPPPTCGTDIGVLVSIVVNDEQAVCWISQCIVV